MLLAYQLESITWASSPKITESTRQDQKMITDQDMPLFLILNYPVDYLLMDLMSKSQKLVAELDTLWLSLLMEVYMLGDTNKLQELRVHLKQELQLGFLNSISKMTELQLQPQQMISQLPFVTKVTFTLGVLDSSIFLIGSNNHLFLYKVKKSLSF